MSQPNLGKPQKALIAIIEVEGGRVVDIRKGSSHLRVDYTFDDTHFFTQTIPRSTSEIKRRWEMNFRADVRKSKRHSEETKQ